MSVDYLGYIVLIGLAASYFWAVMLAECIIQEPNEEKDRIIWLVVILMYFTFGAIVYYFARRPTRIKDYGR